MAPYNVLSPQRVVADHSEGCGGDSEGDHEDMASHVDGYVDVDVGGCLTCEMEKRCYHYCSLTRRSDHQTH